MKKNIDSILSFITVCIIWGTTWMAMSEAVKSIPPILATGMRFLIASPITIMVAIIYKKPLLFPKKQRHWIFFISLFYFTIPFTLMIAGEQFLSTGLSAIIFANMPIIVMLISSFALNLRLAWQQILGLLTAVVSLCLILANELPLSVHQNSLTGLLLITLALFLHAAMYVFSGKYCKHIHVITYNALPSFFASIILVITGALFEPIPSWSQISVVSLSAVLYLAFIGSIAGILSYCQLNQKVSPFVASTCFLIFPIVALLLQDWVTGHSISFFSAMLLIPLLIGMLLTKVSSFSEIKLLKKYW